jgi:AcrR family transcriptional regulator
MQGRHKTQAKERQIVRAASEIFASRDFHRVLMDDVASRAGVGKGTLYRYFPTKDDLYFATISAGIDEIKEQIESLARQGGSLRQVLEAIATGLLRAFWPRRPLLRLVYQYETRLRGPQGTAWMARRRAIADTIGGVFAKALRRGEVGSVDPRLAAEVFLGMVRSANLYRSDADRPETLGRRLTSILLDGLRNGKPTRR